MKATFNYSTTTFQSFEYELSECIGEDVYYQGSDGSLSEHGVVEHDTEADVFFIRWDDCSPHTIFGTPDADIILKNCVI